MRRLEKSEITQRGLEALDWYADQCTVESDTIRLVGNRWRRADDPARLHALRRATSSPLTRRR